MIKSERIHILNDKPILPDTFVLYWMQQAQRIESNLALNYSIDEANRLQIPLEICFILAPSFPEATARHYAFMLEGLQELVKQCRKMALSFNIYMGDPTVEIPHLAKAAACLITDRGYLRIQRKWRYDIADVIDCSMIEIETDSIIPVETVSDHQEYAARTLRPKIHRLLDQFLTEDKLPEARLVLNQQISSLPKGIDISDIDNLLESMKISAYPSRGKEMKGGTSVAIRKLNDFIQNKLERYDWDRNHPDLDATSGLSPYLHFGQISPIFIAKQVIKSEFSEEAKAVFLEELIVRRELSLNFCWFNKHYDTFDNLPSWAYKTLLDHAGDCRIVTYSYEQLENADTHDPYWNAAQREMVNAGTIHNYMRMYWGKKILEWIPDPMSAYEFSLYLNNKYQMDGRDPNSFAGIAWCFGKHDRPWATRPIFGTVRTMTSSGLERKFDMQAYVSKH